MSEKRNTKMIEGLTPQEYYEAGFRFAINFLHHQASDFGDEFQNQLRALINENMTPGVNDRFFEINPFFEVDGYPANTCPIDGGHVPCGGLNLPQPTGS